MNLRDLLWAEIRAAFDPDDYPAKHACKLPTDHPDYRTEDHCQGCNARRAATPPQDRDPGHLWATLPDGEQVPYLHHASAVDACSVPGCEVCGR